MEKLLEKVHKYSDQAEVYAIDENRSKITFENAALKNIESSIQSGMSLRVIKGEKLGFAYTKNLIDRDALIRSAVASLKAGAQGPTGFPSTVEVHSLDTYDPAIASLTTMRLVEECRRICDRFNGRSKGQMNMEAGIITRRIRILNSQGTDLSSSISEYRVIPLILYPGTFSALSRIFLRKAFEETPEEFLDHLLNLFTVSEKEAKIKAKKMKVLFLPEAIYVLLWRLKSATSGRALYHNESPLAERIGEKILHEKLTVFDDPLNSRFPGARAFDDEGTSCRFLPLVEKGVLKNYYYDLFYANKLKEEPTGHGYKTDMWETETISIRPRPDLQHLVIEAGESTLSDMIASIDQGIIVGQALGAHSGNIANGDFSIGLSPGLYVKDGEVVGHVKDTMVSGNIYETLRNVISIENTLHHASCGRFPALLVDDVMVSTKAV